MAAILFFGWGLNQIINDYLGQQADKINAPQRPLAAGKLDPKPALSLTFGLFLLGLFISLKLSFNAGLAYLLIFLLNLSYERLKRLFLGNAGYGLMLSLCVYYGAVWNIGSFGFNWLNHKILTVAALVWAINYVFAFFSDFKDAQGDKLSGVRNAAVFFTSNIYKRLCLLLSTMPLLMLSIFIQLGLLGKTRVSFLPILPAMLSLVSLIIAQISLSRAQKGYFKWVITGAILFEISILVIL